MPQIPRLTGYAPEKVQWNKTPLFRPETRKTPLYTAQVTHAGKIQKLQ